MVGQEPILFGMSIIENIRFGREDVTDAEVIDATKQANAYDFIVKLPEVIFFNSDDIDLAASVWHVSTHELLI